MTLQAGDYRRMEPVIRLSVIEKEHKGNNPHRSDRHTLEKTQKPLQKQIREKQCPGRFQKSPKTGANVSFFIKLKIYIFA